MEVREDFLKEEKIELRFELTMRGMYVCVGVQMERKDKGMPGTLKSMCKEPVVGKNVGIQGTE